MKSKKPLQNNYGMTLIEVVVAVAIFSIVSLMIYTTLSAGTRILYKSNSLYNSNNALFSNIEKGKVSTRQQGSIFFDLDGDSVESIGTYLTLDSDSGNNSLIYFSSVEPEESYTELYKKMMKYFAMSVSELKSLGFSYNFVSNDRVRDFIRFMEFGDLGEVWPEFDRTILERYKMLHPPPTDKLYMQPYFHYGSSSADPDRDVILFVGTGISANWNAKIIYNHFDEKWYWLPNSFDVRTYPDNPEKWRMENMGVANKLWDDVISVFGDRWIPIDSYPIS